MAGFMEPPRIQRLDEHVVNRIAAGEVVQRPSSAVKEMLENSVDAGATQVIITVKDGGLKTLQIQDNGHGVQADDLPLLCERHATSKLREYDDLESINTLGFRGEALASISYVSHVTVTTMCPGDSHGLRVTYKDSQMDPAGPKPCAAVPGTTICAEHLFYNVPMRRKVLKSAAEEYNRVLDVVSRYAVFEEGISFTCKRQGEARADIHTLASDSRRDNIRSIYGAAVARELVPLRLEISPGAGSGDGAASSQAEFTVEGYMSSANYIGKKTTFILFINKRSVECSPIKRMLEAVYASVLPKTSKPFIFMDIRLPCKHVDVNLHPTKKEVGFVHQEELVELLRQAAERTLMASNTSRSYTQQTLVSATRLLPPPEAGRNGKQEDGEGDAATPSAKAEASTRRDAAGGDHKLVRTDPRIRSLEAFIHRPGEAGGTARAAGPSSAAAAAAAAGMGLVRKRARSARTEAWKGTSGDKQEVPRQRRQPPATMTELSSIQELLQEATEAPHQGLSELLSEHTFVGMTGHTQALVQHRTGLYLVDAAALSYDLVYQQVLCRFEHFKRVVLNPPPRLRELVVVALDAEEAMGRWEESDGGKEELGGLTEQLIVQQSEMLGEYFGMDISSDGCLHTLPQVIDNCPPDMDRLPHFILRLGRDIDWESEKTCFQSMAEWPRQRIVCWLKQLPSDVDKCKVIADFYCIKEPVGDDAIGEGACPGDDGGDGQGQGSSQKSPRDSRKWLIQHVMFPMMKLHLRPHKKRATDGSVVEVARLEKLYRVFERC